MNILCIGDVVGSAGCEFLRRRLPSFKRLKSIDAVIVNGENSADGNGISMHSAEHIFSSGADVITTGNHAFRQQSIHNEFDENDRLLRPANYPSAAPGKGYCVVDFGYTKMAVINLMGTVYLESLSCPFETADKLLKQAKDDGAKIIIVDFHAEATAEKKALGFYLDGKISAMFGTHTHVQTADTQVLPCGTGFITDAGMTGPFVSVLGVKPELSIRKMKDKLPTRFVNADGECFMCGVIFDIGKDGKCISAEAVQIR